MTENTLNFIREALVSQFDAPEELVYSKAFYAHSLGDLGFDIVKLAKLEHFVADIFKLKIKYLTKNVLVGDLIEMLEHEDIEHKLYVVDMKIWSIVRALVFKTTKERPVMYEPIPINIHWLLGTFT
ncbi:MAG: hypothetical protein LBL47_01555, partial [Lactobacillus sp.]|nr:hypothetical protein [Lactobacillus sp.]